MSAKGLAQLDNLSPALEIEFEAERFAALARPDRHVVVTGSGGLALDRRSLELTGRFKAEEGMIELADADTPASPTM